MHSDVYIIIYVSYNKWNVICRITRSGETGYLSEENSHFFLDIHEITINGAKWNL